MSADDDYPELARITRGVGVEVLEDAEEQAERALDELDRLSAALDRAIQEGHQLTIEDIGTGSGPMPWSCHCGEQDYYVGNPKQRRGPDRFRHATEAEATAAHAEHLAAVKARLLQPQESRES